MEINTPDNVVSLTTYFAEIILPLAVGNTFTYRIPTELQEEMIPGKRVMVPFGHNKVYSGLILAIHSLPPKAYEAKYISSMLDSQPILLEKHMQFWIWISEYYLCHLGEVMKAALPSGLKLESESYLVLNQSDNLLPGEFHYRENQILDLIEKKGEIRIAELPEILGIKSVLVYVKSLISKKRIFIREELSKGYQPKRQTFIRISRRYEDQEQKKALFADLDKRPSQLTILLGYYSLIQSHEKEVSKIKLLETSGGSSSTLGVLIRKGIFESFEKRISRIESSEFETYSPFTLSLPQEQAYQEIKSQLEIVEVVLLHGITSSGKTQVYFQLIKDYLGEGKQILYLLPEIALTAQLVNRLRREFGDHVGIFHSQFNENERVETWERVIQGEYTVIIGARSALFLPFPNLGLVIVDEEHDSSFKQMDPAPRYNARDSAIYLGSSQKAKVLLGSATPSIESYYNALNGKYGLVKLMERFGGVSMPSIEISDLSQERKEKSMKFQFSARLLKHLEKTLAEKDQIILFQNRRGYSPYILCKSCGFIPRCTNCDVSLTLHKSTQKLHCHYCGYRIDVFKQCPVCENPILEEQGFGTEKIEEDLQSLYPEIRIGRMDQDTTRGKNGHLKIVEALEENRIQVLVGTQMVSKGLDFGRVQLIGVINADQILNFPDFRAFEKGYQVLTQVSGRAGRRLKQGKVIIQTYSPLHPILSFIQKSDYEGLYLAEIFEREKFHYPPFSRLIRIICKNKDPKILQNTCLVLSDFLKIHFGDRVLGPVQALVPRVRNQYIQEFLLKLSRKYNSPTLVKKVLMELIGEVRTKKEFRSTLIQIDVDPA